MSMMKKKSQESVGKAGYLYTRYTRRPTLNP